MINQVLVFIGALIVILWGIAHLIFTKSVVTGFKLKSIDDTRVVTMEWIMEGLTLCFIGALALGVTMAAGADDPISHVVYEISAVMLVVMAVVSLFTGARVSFIAYQLCPVIFLTAAILFFFGVLF